MNVSIRLARPGDAADMAEIHARSWEAAYGAILPQDFIREKNATRPALYKRIIKEDNAMQYIILAEGKTAGILCVGPPREEDAAIRGGGEIDGSFYELHGIYLLLPPGHRPKSNGIRHGKGPGRWKIQYDFMGFPGESERHRLL